MQDFIIACIVKFKRPRAQAETFVFRENGGNGRIVQGDGFGHEDALGRRV